MSRELNLVGETVGSAQSGDYVIDREGRTVAVGGDDSGPVMRAAFREPWLELLNMPGGFTPPWLEFLKIPAGFTPP